MKSFIDLVNTARGLIMDENQKQSANYLTVFYIMGTLIVKRLRAARRGTTDLLNHVILASV